MNVFRWLRIIKAWPRMCKLAIDFAENADDPWSPNQDLRHMSMVDLIQHVEGKHISEVENLQ